MLLLESGRGDAQLQEAALRAASALLCGAENPDGLMQAASHLPGLLHLLKPGTFLSISLWGYFGKGWLSPVTSPGFCTS
jgi:hypothetical protein